MFCFFFFSLNRVFFFLLHVCYYFLSLSFSSSHHREKPGEWIHTKHTHNIAFFVVGILQLLFLLLLLTYYTPTIEISFFVVVIPVFFLFFYCYDQKQAKNTIWTFVIIVAKSFSFLYLLFDTIFLLSLSFTRH